MAAACCSAPALCTARCSACSINGWIERVEEDNPARDRRIYRLTSRGRRNLQMEIERMRHLTKLAALRVARKEA